jgi:hypothetical protein
MNNGNARKIDEHGPQYVSGANVQFALRTTYSLTQE